MEIPGEAVYAQIQKRAQSDPLVSEILRSAMLSAALQIQQEMIEQLSGDTPENVVEIQAVPDIEDDDAG